MRRLAIVKRGSRGQLQLGANVRPGFHPHSRWRHLVDAVLYEVRSWRRWLAQYRPRRPAGNTQSPRTRCPTLWVSGHGVRPSLCPAQSNERGWVFDRAAMGLRQDKRSRDRQGAVSPPQESGPATGLRPTQGDQNPRVCDGAAMGLRPPKGMTPAGFRRSGL